MLLDKKKDARPIFVKKMKMKIPFVIAFVGMCVMVGATCIFHHPKIKSTDDTKTDIVIRGSDSEFNLILFLSNKYKETHPGINFDMMGGGSSKGF